MASEREAEAELALFLREPSRYIDRVEARQLPEPKVIMAAALVDAFEEHLAAIGRERRHIVNVRNYLNWWTKKLRGRDLCKVTLQDLRRCLATAARAKRNRIASYKVFCTFLREELAVLPRGSDASLDLHAPVPLPEKARRHKGYSIERVEKFYAAVTAWDSERSTRKSRQGLVQCIRDCIILHAKTGMHQTEIDRLSRGGGVITALSGQGDIAGTIHFLHKSGYKHIVSVDQQTLMAARRLQRRGRLPAGNSFVGIMAKAAKDLGVPPIKFGELRHSFTTWARTSGELVRPMGRGVSVEEVASVLGHTSTRTTRLHYDGTKVPPMVKVPINLFHTDDPQEPSVGLRLVAS